MISLDKEQIYLLELIKASLFGKTPEIPEDANWKKIFEAAKSQCIVPLLMSFVPLKLRNEWKSISYQSKAHYMQMLYEQHLLVDLFDANNIPFVIFKGTAAAVYYPVPSARTFGDIDLFVPDEYFESARRLLDTNGYLFFENNERHCSYYKNGIEFELHNKISSIYYKNVDWIFINGLNNTSEFSIGSHTFPALPIYENGLVLLGHILAHLKQSGVGLRQIIDWMMFVHKELDDSAWNNHFRDLAREAGLEKLAITVTYMCKKWLGLPNDITWCNTADEDVADQLLLRVLNDGNFGCDRAPFENISISIKNDGLFKHLQRTGVENLSLAQKHKMFRPFAWLYQMFRYAGLGIVGLFTGKKIFRKDKQNLKLEELWKRLK